MIKHNLLILMVLDARLRYCCIRYQVGLFQILQFQEVGNLLDIPHGLSADSLVLVLQGPQNGDLELGDYLGEPHPWGMGIRV